MLLTQAALLKDLDTWSQKYPESDYKDDRSYHDIQAYNGTNQPARVLEIGSQLMARDLKKSSTPTPRPDRSKDLPFFTSCRSTSRSRPLLPPIRPPPVRWPRASWTFAPTFVTAALQQPASRHCCLERGFQPHHGVAKTSCVPRPCQPAGGPESPAPPGRRQGMRHCRSRLQESHRRLPGQRTVRLSIGQGVTPPSRPPVPRRFRRRCTNSRVPRPWYSTLEARWTKKALNTYLDSASIRSTAVWKGWIN